MDNEKNYEVIRAAMENLGLPDIEARIGHIKDSILRSEEKLADKEKIRKELSERPAELESFLDNLESPIEFSTSDMCPDEKWSVKDLYTYEKKIYSKFVNALEFSRSHLDLMREVIPESCPRAWVDFLRRYQRAEAIVVVRNAAEKIHEETSAVLSRDEILYEISDLMDKKTVQHVHEV